MNSGPEDLSNPTVLVVDDDADTRHVLSRTVASLGINVLEAKDGRQALTIMKKHRIDVVISDLVMPRMSGIMMLHSMLEQGHHMPFILVTGFSDKDSAIQALRLGAFDYLEKPVHETDLLSVTQEALKVSKEQIRLVEAVRTDDSPLKSGKVDRHAELAIMKMRTFRYKGENFDYAISKGNAESWHDLKELFIEEAEQQLIFNEGALFDLVKFPGQTAKELAFILRVVQSVRIASEAVRLTDIAEMAWSLESTIAAFKHQPSELTPAHVDLLVKANGILRSKVKALADGVASDVQKSLDHLTEVLRKNVKESA